MKCIILVLLFSVINCYDINVELSIVCSSNNKTLTMTKLCENIILNNNKYTESYNACNTLVNEYTNNKHVTIICNLANTYVSRLNEIHINDENNKKRDKFWKMIFIIIGVVEFVIICAFCIFIAIRKSTVNGKLPV